MRVIIVIISLFYLCSCSKRTVDTLVVETESHVQKQIDSTYWSNKMLENEMFYRNVIDSIQSYKEYIDSTYVNDSSSVVEKADGSRVEYKYKYIYKKVTQKEYESKISTLQDSIIKYKQECNSLYLYKVREDSLNHKRDSIRTEIIEKQENAFTKMKNYVRYTLLLVGLIAIVAFVYKFRNFLLIR